MAVSFEWLGVQAYQPMWKQLKYRAASLASGKEKEVIWACEHEPMYTTGRRAIDNSLNAGKPSKVGLPAPLIVTDRGGETTFHGTGQIMLYPIIHIRKRGLSVREYIHLLEESAIQTLAEHGIITKRRCGLPGVWTKEGKIVAMGIRVSQGIAYHGMAMNISVDMKYFEAINPCGLGKKAVNLQDICKPLPAISQLAQAWSHQLNILLNPTSDIN